MDGLDLGCPNQPLAFPRGKVMQQRQFRWSEESLTEQERGKMSRKALEHTSVVWCLGPLGRACSGDSVSSPFTVHPSSQGSEIRGDSPHVVLSSLASMGMLNQIPLRVAKPDISNSILDPHINWQRSNGSTNRLLYERWEYSHNQNGLTQECDHLSWKS